MVNPKPKWCSTGQSQSFPGIGWLHQSSCLYHPHGYTPEGLYSASDVYIHWFIKCLWRACYVYTRRKKCDDDTLISTAVALRVKRLFYDSRANITYFSRRKTKGSLWGFREKDYFWLMLPRCFHRRTGFQLVLQNIFQFEKSLITQCLWHMLFNCVLCLWHFYSFFNTLH